MPIPKPSQTKQPILKYLAKAGKPVKKATIIESMGKHFNLTKREIEETSLKGSKRFAQCIIAATKEMKAAGFVRSPRHGYLAITSKGSGFDGSKATTTNGRKRGKPGRPPKAKVKAKNGRRKAGRPKMQVGAKNGRRKPGRPKMKTAKQPSVTPIKQDDKMIQRTTDIVRSFAGNNKINASQLPKLIQGTYTALSGLGSSAASRKTVVKRKYTRRKKVAKKKA